MGSELDAIRNKIGSDSYARFMGIQLLDLKKGYSKLSLTITDRMVNFHKVAHGGAIFALADAAFAAAANSHGQKALALSMNINYCSPAREGMKLVAEGFEESLGRRTGLYRMMVRSDEGQLIATSYGTVYRKPEESI